MRTGAVVDKHTLPWQEWEIRERFLTAPAETRKKLFNILCELLLCKSYELRTVLVRNGIFENIKLIINDTEDDDMASGKLWTEAECAYLKESVGNGESFLKIAQKLGRKESACILKYKRLLYGRGPKQNSDYDTDENYQTAGAEIFDNTVTNTSDNSSDKKIAELFEDAAYNEIDCLRRDAAVITDENKKLNERILCLEKSLRETTNELLDLQKDYKDIVDESFACKRESDTLRECICSAKRFAEDNIRKYELLEDAADNEILCLRQDLRLSVIREENLTDKLYSVNETVDKLLQQCNKLKTDNERLESLAQERFNVGWRESATLSAVRNLTCGQIKLRSDSVEISAGGDVKNLLLSLLHGSNPDIQVFIADNSIRITKSSCLNLVEGA